MMNALAAVLLGLLLQEERHLKAAEKIELPAARELERWAESGDRARRIVATISDRKIWAAAFQAIEAKTGLFNENPRIKISIEESDGSQDAKGGGLLGEGRVIFNMKSLLVSAQKREEYVDSLIAGKAVRWIVPPARLEDTITHELTHVFAGSFREAWLTEGLASYVAADEAAIRSFIHGKRPVEILDRVSAPEDVYARGWAFLSWLESTRGSDAVKAFVASVIRDRFKVREAAEAAAGLEWAELQRRERAWAENFIRAFGPPK